MKNDKDLNNAFVHTNNSKDFQDLHGRRAINAGKSKDGSDLITRKEVIDQLNLIRAFVGMPLIKD